MKFKVEHLYTGAPVISEKTGKVVGEVTNFRMHLDSHHSCDIVILDFDEVEKLIGASRGVVSTRAETKRIERGT